MSGLKSNAHLATLTSAIFSISIQAVSILALDPAAYGHFSLVYLLFAWFASIQLSLVLEPWIRTVGGVASGIPPVLKHVNLQYSVASGLVTLLICYAVPSLRGLAIYGAVAVASNVFIAGQRYTLTWEKRYARVLASNVVGIAVTVAGTFGAVWWLGRTDVAVGLIWAVSSLAAALTLPLPALGSVREFGQWVRDHKQAIVVLLRDSLVMDISSIGVPYALAPILGVQNFGVYRAVSNVAAPVRIVMTPIRPMLLQQPIEAARSRKRLTLLFVAVVLCSAVVAVILWGLPHLGLNLGTINYLSPFAVVTGIFVGANLLSNYCYIVARAHSDAKGLAIGRAVQTVLSIALPVIFGITHGLAGAINAYVGATVAMTAVWVWVIFRPAPQQISA